MAHKISEQDMDICKELAKIARHYGLRSLTGSYDTSMETIKFVWEKKKSEFGELQIVSTQIAMATIKEDKKERAPIKLVSINPEIEYKQ